MKKLFIFLMLISLAFSQAWRNPDIVPYRLIFNEKTDAEITALDNPPTGWGFVYEKDDQQFYFMDEDSVEYLLSFALTGGIADSLILIADGDSIKFLPYHQLYMIDVEVNDTQIFGLDSTGNVIMLGDATITGGDITLAAAGVKFTGADGVLTLLGLGDGNDENLTFDFDNAAANEVNVASGTGVTGIDFGTIDLKTDYVWAQIFDTDVAAAAVTLSGTTLAADGTDAHINIAITPKGTGEVDITKVDIDGGAIDGTVIGANSASTGAFSTGTFSGILSVDDVTETTSGVTGSIHTDGGLGVAKDIYIGDDILLATAGVIDWNATDKMTHGANLMTLSGFTTWDMGAVATLDFNGASSITASGNNLLTLDGGTAGVRLEDVVGIGLAPTANWMLGIENNALSGGTLSGINIEIGGTLTGTNSAWVGYLGSSAWILPDGVTTPNINTLYLSTPVLTETGTSTVTNLSTFYISSAPNAGTVTVTNGPYSIFVDAGTSRFDGDIGDATNRVPVVYGVDINASDDILLANGAVVGITGNEIITFNAAGSINITGATFDVDGAATATTYAADAGITTGKDGTDGIITVYSEQGATDYSFTINPHATMTSAANFYFPADEPAGTYLLNMTSGGIMGFDATDYQEEDATIDALAGLTIAAGEIIIGTGADAFNMLGAGATTTILVGGGAANPVWTTATGTGAPVRAGSPTFTTQITTPIINATSATLGSNATTLSFDAAATINTSGNNLLTLNGGTAGVRVDQMFGINITPTDRYPIYFATNTTNTFAGSGAGFYYTPTLVGADSQNQYGMVLQPLGVTANATSGVVSYCGTLNLNEPIITKTGANDITNAFTLRIADAPTEGVNNYAFWVDIGESRFDGAVDVDAAFTAGSMVSDAQVTATTTVSGATYGSDGSVSDAELLTLDDGATTQLLVGGGAGSAPVWGADIPTAVTIGTKYIYRADGTDVAVADGGTNISSYAIGDLLYASTGTVLSKLAGVAAGQPLLSGGVTTAPAYAGYTFSGTAAQTYTFPAATSTLAAVTDYGEMGNLSSAAAAEVIATADQWQAMMHANINIGLSSGFTYVDGTSGAISATSIGAGATVTMTSAGHTLAADDYITINGTTTYNRIEQVVSTDGNDFVINQTNSEVDEGGGNAAFQEGSYLLCAATGVYKANWAGAFKQSLANAQTTIVSAFLNDTQCEKCVAYEYLENVNDYATIAGCALHSYTAGDRIWFAIQTTAAQTITFTVRNITIR